MASALLGAPTTGGFGMQVPLLLLLLLLTASSSKGNIVENERNPATCRAHPISVDSCRLKRINGTSIAEQSQVSIALKPLEAIMDSGCAPFVRLLICTMHLPMCKSDLEIKPCYEFCMQVRHRCGKKMSKIGHAWPQGLECAGLKREKEKLCITIPESEWKDEERLIRDRTNGWPADFDFDDTDRQPPQPRPGATTRPARRCSRAEVTLAVDSLCAPKCHANLMFNREDKEFASVWMLVWSVICLASTALAVATFAMDSERFRFPERPMVWVAVCYLMYSSGHILRICLGPQIACSGIDSAKGHELYRVSRHAGHWCAVVFLILYFSSLAGCLWWVLLTVCWYLCAAKKWAHEALSDKSVWLHVCAWGLPLLMSVVLLVLHRIEGDELTHLCVVDGSDKTNTLIFLIVPVALCLAVGICFLLCSFCSTMSMRHSLKWSGNVNFRRLEKLMSKIILFSVLFVLPTASVLAITVYEYSWRDTWTASLTSTLEMPRCVNSSGLLLTEQNCVPASRPTSALFMLKIFMSLAVGLPSGLIIWFNCKSLDSWLSCCSRVVLRRKRKPAQLHAADRQMAFLPKQPPGHLLGSSHNKYPPINGIGTSEV